MPAGTGANAAPGGRDDNHGDRLTAAGEADGEVAEFVGQQAEVGGDVGTDVLEQAEAWDLDLPRDAGSDRELELVP